MNTHTRFVLFICAYKSIFQILTEFVSNTGRVAYLLFFINVSQVWWLSALHWNWCDPLNATIIIRWVQKWIQSIQSFDVKLLEPRHLFHISFFLIEKLDIRLTFWRNCSIFVSIDSLFQILLKWSLFNVFYQTFIRLSNLVANFDLWR